MLRADNLSPGRWSLCDQHDLPNEDQQKPELNELTFLRLYTSTLTVSKVRLVDYGPSTMHVEKRHGALCASHFDIIALGDQLSRDAEQGPWLLGRMYGAAGMKKIVRSWLCQMGNVLRERSGDSELLRLSIRSRTLLCSA